MWWAANQLCARSELIVLLRVLVYGGLVVLAASIWAWAVGFAVWYGAIVGVVLGLAAGIFLDSMMRDLWEPGDLSSMAAPIMGFAYVALMLVISIIGVIVGIYW